MCSIHCSHTTQLHLSFPSILSLKLISFLNSILDFFFLFFSSKLFLLLVHTIVRTLLKMGYKSLEKPKPKHRKGLWSPEEDERLRNYIIHHGHGCWSNVPINAGKFNSFLIFFKCS